MPPNEALTFLIQGVSLFTGRTSDYLTVALIGAYDCALLVTKHLLFNYWDCASSVECACRAI